MGTGVRSVSGLRSRHAIELTEWPSTERTATHGASPSWDTHMLSPEGQKELRAFAVRVQARFRTEVSAAPACDRPGALQLESL